ncbi:hypothetical protein GGR56DRAFT_650979 [Xylariaceae sp. FL0804]|nr:hypothetical protein GGR56DRAFT_650979 [Xylariaceae sp. FL0804]
MLARPGTMNRNLGRNSSSGGNDRSASSSTRTAALSSGVPPDAEGDGGRQRQEQRKAGPEHRETAGAKRQEGEEVAEEGGGEEKAAAAGPRPRRIFDGVVVYVNGSTHPLISDHRLKRVLAEHGGRLSTHLGRRQVTHVILGKPAANNGPSGSGNNGSGSANGHDKGAGGGLAGGKLQREIQRLRSAGGGGAGGGVRFVGVEWVLESVARGRRLPEARFATDVRVGAARAQRSVLDVYTAKRPPPPEKKAPADGDGGGGGIGSGTPAVDGES